MSSSPAVAPCPSELFTPKDPPPQEVDPNNNNSNNNDDSNEAGGASRNQRRRLKKLRKRAALFCPRGDLSGMTKREDWEEVKQTREDANEEEEDKEEDYAPWVGMRQTKKHLKDRNKERYGFDHQYTLKYVITSSSTQPTATNGPKKNSRKRPRQDEGTVSRPIPSWICLHNPVCVDHVAVLEIHIPNGKKPGQLKPEDVYARVQAATNTQAGYPTKWFDGPRPQSISDILLYEKPAQVSRKKAKPLDLTTEDGKQQLMEALKSFVLSSEDLKEEGYPFSESDAKLESTPTTIISSEFRNPTAISLEDSKSIVQPTHTTVEDRKFPFVQTTTRTTNTKTDDAMPRVLGLDCEMVKTKNGIELARVTLIEYQQNDNTSSSNDKDYRVLMDELVLPYPPILDYVTEYSGITAAMVKDVTTRLEQVQASLLTYVGPNDILVGHSLENDLIALRWIHPTVIDTAVLFHNSHRKFKYSLKHLSCILLRKRIQDSAVGHCSEEDAAATLELAIRRAKEGPTFAIQSNDKQFWIPPSTEKSAQVFIGPSSWLTNHITKQPSGIHALTCEDVDHPNTKAILSWLTGPKRRAGLVWANLILTTPSHLDTLEKLLMDLKTKLSCSTVLMVNIQEGYAAATEESQRRNVRKSPRTTLPWTEEEEQNCRSLVDESRKGKVFWVTKHPGPSGVEAGSAPK